MLSSNPGHILALLRSGEAIEIGVPVRSKRPSGPTASQVALGFGAIYLIWGSTYLGIRYAVETIPPLFMMGIRHSVAGILVYLWARRSGAPAANARQWKFAVVAGGLLFLGGHGLLAWAEQRIPSGLAALMCATLPLWTVLLARVDGTERRLGYKAWAGVLLGFAGVAVLIGPGSLAGHLDLLAAAGAMASALVWVIGTAYTRRVAMPSSKLLSAAMQMICGGVLLLIVGALSGETRHFQFANLTVRSVLALGYLIVFGSIIAFSVYTWLVSVSSPSMLSTYAYVNPVIAVFLGWALAGEALGARTILATGIIIAGVVLVTRRRPQPVRERSGGAPGKEAWEAAGD
ncbi:MAG TPA: EamA family transporter [Terriglobales bacterium]|nr:EamA family transporter [Terriglobales bacterium]